MAAAHTTLRTVRFNISISSSKFSNCRGCNRSPWASVQSPRQARRSPAYILTSVRSAVLDNGLRILIQELHTAPLVSVWCWYRVGSGDEAPGQTGVSHWVEHMN